MPLRIGGRCLLGHIQLSGQSFVPKTGVPVILPTEHSFGNRLTPVFTGFFVVLVCARIRSVLVTLILL